MGKSSINGPFSMAMLNNQRVHWSPAGHFFTIYVLHHSVNGGEPWIRHWPKGVQKLGEKPTGTEDMQRLAVWKNMAMENHSADDSQQRCHFPWPFWVEGRFKRQIYQMADARFLDFISLNGWTQDSSETFKIYDCTDTARFHPGCPRSKRLNPTRYQ